MNPKPRPGAKFAAERIAQSIFVLRGHRVLLDSTLAALYGVETRVLIQGVKRNLDRFPSDFMFRLSNQDVAVLRSQFVMSNGGPGGRRTTPYAFTEQGVAMLSSVLRSRQAIEINIEIMRAFVWLRGIVASNRDLAKKLNELESKLAAHDETITGILNAIRQLMTPPEPSRKRRIGFVQDD